MASPIDKLVIQLEADTKKLRKELDRVHKKLDKTKKKTKGTNDAFKKLKGALIAVGAVQLVRQVIEINRTFEDLEATLRAVTGSAQAAETSFELIRAFTSSTTFQIEEVAQAFITLKQAGIVPTSDALMDFGNFAAGMGKSVTQLAQAAFNATTGEMEMLKQFGVIARQQGDQITVTFDGTTKTIERSGDAIVEYLRSIGREKFPTAIEERFNTLSGAISNLNDQVSEFSVSIGDGIGGMGLRQGMIDLAKATGSLLETLRPLGQVLGSILGLLAQLVTVIVETIDSTYILIRAILDVSNYMNIFKGITDGTITSYEDFKDAVRGGQGDLDELDAKLQDLIKTGGDFRVLFSSDEEKDYKLFLELRKQVEKTRSSVNDLIENDFARLKKIVAKTVESQLKLDIASSIEAGDTTIGRTVERFGQKFFQINEGEVEKRRKAFIKALLGVESIEEFMTEVTDEILDPVEDLKSELGKELDKVLVKSAGDISNLETVYKALNEAIANGVVTQEQATAQLREFLETTGPYGKALAKIGDEVEGLASNLSDDLTEALMNGENALESFRSFAQNVVQAVISSFMELMVIQPIVDAILGSFGMSSSKGGVSAENTYNSLNSAGGGAMFSGQPRLVGERGPELFVPHTAGTLKNNMNTKNAMGGGATTVIHQNINFATGVVPTVRAEVTKMLPQIAEVTKGAVQESAMRGGNFRRSLVGG